MEDQESFVTFWLLSNTAYDPDGTQYLSAAFSYRSLLNLLQPARLRPEIPHNLNPLAAYIRASPSEAHPEDTLRDNLVMVVIFFPLFSAQNKALAE
jgi:hypothetical protein